MFQVVDGRRPEIPGSLQKDHPLLVKLIQACWAQDPNLEPTFPQIVESLKVMQES